MSLDWSLLVTFFKAEKNNLTTFFHHMSEQRKIWLSCIARSNLSFRLVSGFTTIVKLFKTWDDMFSLCTAPVVMPWPTYLILLPSNVAKSPLRDQKNLQWEPFGQLHYKTLIWWSETSKSIRTAQSAWINKYEFLEEYIIFTGNA